MTADYAPAAVTLHSVADRALTAATASTDGRYADALTAIASARARLNNAEATIQAAAPHIADEVAGQLDGQATLFDAPGATE